MVYVNLWNGVFGKTDRRCYERVLRLSCTTRTCTCVYYKLGIVCYRTRVSDDEIRVTCIFTTHLLHLQHQYNEFQFIYLLGLLSEINRNNLERNVSGSDVRSAFMVLMNDIHISLFIAIRWRKPAVVAKP